MNKKYIYSLLASMLLISQISFSQIDADQVELDEVILDFEKNTDEKHEVDVSVDIQNATLHMKRVKKPHISLATINGKVVKKIKDIYEST